MVPYEESPSLGDGNDVGSGCPPTIMGCVKKAFLFQLCGVPSSVQIDPISSRIRTAFRIRYYSSIKFRPISLVKGGAYRGTVQALITCLRLLYYLY